MILVANLGNRIPLISQGGKRRQCGQKRSGHWGSDSKRDLPSHLGAAQAAPRPQCDSGRCTRLPEMLLLKPTAGSRGPHRPGQAGAAPGGGASALPAPGPRPPAPPAPIPGGGEGKAPAGSPRPEPRAHTHLPAAPPGCRGRGDAGSFRFRCPGGPARSWGRSPPRRRPRCQQIQPSLPAAGQSGTGSYRVFRRKHCPGQNAARPGASAPPRPGPCHCTPALREPAGSQPAIASCGGLMMSRFAILHHPNTAQAWYPNV